MAIIDPASGRPLPDSAIQRVLFVSNNVHVYQIPPITSTKGFAASTWTSPTQPTAQQIFTCRLRIMETSIEGKIKADVVLEDGNTGDLFAAAPYTSSAVVQQANDSSRFFAIRVQGEGGMKATLGVGFEDRSPAFDFGIALGEVRKITNMDGSTSAPPTRGGSATSKTEQDEKKDFSLKDGQTINIQVGARGRRAQQSSVATAPQDDNTALFSIAPPPSAGRTGDSAISTDVSSDIEGKSAQELGFDDGEFGEFQ